MDTVLFQIPKRYARGTGIRFSFPVSPQEGIDDVPNSAGELASKLIADYEWFHPDNPFIHQGGELFEIDETKTPFPFSI